MEIDNPARLMEMVNGFRTSRIILTATALGVFDHLGGEGTGSSDLAGAVGTNPRATDRLLNALAALGLLRKNREKFSNTPFSDKFLTRHSASYLGGFELTNQMWTTWSTLTEAVVSGSTVVMESPINERPEAWQEAFIMAMHARAGQQAAEVADVLDLSNIRNMIDVGGGSGAYSFAMIRKQPDIRATVFDLPNIVPITRRYTEASGLSGQVGIIPGNYLEDDFGTGYDLVLMSAIIHINSPEENRLLISKGAGALHPGGQLVIIDHIMSEDRTAPAVGALFAINMLVGTLNGDTYTENEIGCWMRDAGLKDIRLKETPSGVQVMTGLN